MERPLNILEVSTSNATVYHIGDGYYYYARRHKVNRTALACAQSKKCPGRASMPRDPLWRLADELTITRPHDHEPKPRWLQVQLARKRIVERCTFEGTLFRTIYQQETERLSPEVAAELPYESLGRCMYRARCSKVLEDSIPATLLEYGEALEANPRFGQTKQGEQFYRATLVDEGNDSAVVFSSPTLLLQMLQDCTTLEVDATFRVVPNTPPSYQLLTVSAVMYDHSFPVISALMQRKTQSLYALVFTFVSHLFGDWKPQIITCDFDVTLQNSLRESWPEASIVGSWFHIANSMNKKSKRLGMAQLLEENQFAHRAYKMCQVIALLPAEIIAAGFEAVLKFAQQNKLLQIPAFEKFLNYVHRVWITGVGAQSLSVYRQKLRTNNWIESYHRKLKYEMRQPDSNIWVFTDGLRKLEHDAVTILSNFCRGTPGSSSSRPCYLLAGNKLRGATTSLNKGAYTIDDFLVAASHCIDYVHNEVYNVPDESLDEPDEEEIQVRKMFLERYPLVGVLRTRFLHQKVAGLSQQYLPQDKEPSVHATKGRAKSKGSRGKSKGSRGKSKGSCGKSKKGLGRGRGGAKLATKLVSVDIPSLCKDSTLEQMTASKPITDN